MKLDPAPAPRVSTVTWRVALVVVLALVSGMTVSVASHAASPIAEGLSPQAIEQIRSLIAEKKARTPVQRKIDSRLLYAAKMARGEAITASVPTLAIRLSDVNDEGAVLDVRAKVSPALLDELARLGAEVIDASARYENVRLRVDLRQVEALAALPGVAYVQPKQEAKVFGAMAGGGAQTNVGSQNSQGDLKHNAASARAFYLVNGTGVKVGVLSDGVTNLAASQALGDLGPVTVLPGQTGSGDEGTAMLEIIHDLAPGAQLYFATGVTSLASFAQNIRDLRTAGCDIIVDDVRYFAESPFHDGQTVVSQTNGAIATQAVKDVVASGALYFSSAGNGGNKNDGTSGTWEGDFLSAGPATGILMGVGLLHNFGGGQTFDAVALGTNDSPITLTWSDPLAASNNDYDIYLLDSTGTMLRDASTDLQTGTQDPFEAVAAGALGDRIVVVLFSGSGRFLHLSTNGDRLSLSTPGEITGHAATTVAASFAVAATSAQVGGTSPFTSSSVVETFSSDGPRRVFYQSNGTPFTPGNFTSTGGILLQKPDLTAADGVSVSGVGSFPSPFYGTSAAAPHAAAIAALVKSRKLTLTAAQVRTALLTGPVDIEAAGVDRDSGAGIVMADRALASLGPPRSRPDGDFDGDGKSDVSVFRPSNSTWYVLKSSTSYTANAQYPWGASTDILVPRDYDGDGKTDVAVFRNGQWFILLSTTNFAGFASYSWGASTDIPVPRDYDGDGKADVAVFRPSTGTWFILLSTTNSTTFASYPWGASTDIPTPGDFDGDGKADLALFRPAGGQWFVKLSSTNYTTFVSYQWGASGDTPVPADYDGDGKFDIAIFRPSTAVWFIKLSTTGFASYVTYPWGASSDVVVPSDYDGDAKADPAIFRPSTSTWYILKSSTNFTTYSQYGWGAATDIPINKRP